MERQIGRSLNGISKGAFSVGLLANFILFFMTMTTMMVAVFVGCAILLVEPGRLGAIWLGRLLARWRK